MGSVDLLTQSLKKHFGFETFKGNQKEIIQNVLNGNDTFVLMPTGGGKSLCYQLPALLREGTAIIISPLIALMKNQVDAMRGFSETDGIAHFLNSSLTKSETIRVKEDILDGKTKLLYVAPESLTKESNIEFLKQIKISFYAVDEAHCISEWGHDFRPEYRRIRPIVEQIGKAPIIALTATATPKVQNDIQKNLDMIGATVYKSSFNRKNLYYEVRPKVNATQEIIKFINNNKGKSGIIYCLSRKKVEELAEILQVNGIKAMAYHAGMDATTRSRNQDMFLMEDVDVIVATIAFGMGIDKPDVRFVIHYDIPKSLEGYYQDTGRAGRESVPVLQDDAADLREAEGHDREPLPVSEIVPPASGEHESAADGRAAHGGQQVDGPVTLPVDQVHGQGQEQGRRRHQQQKAQNPEDNRQVHRSRLLGEEILDIGHAGRKGEDDDLVSRAHHGVAAGRDDIAAVQHGADHGRAREIQFREGDVQAAASRRQVELQDLGAAESQAVGADDRAALHVAGDGVRGREARRYGHIHPTTPSSGNRET